MHGFYLNERMMQICVEEAHREAEIRRLQQQVRTGRPSWLVLQRNRILSWLGRFLIASGQRLLQSVAPPPSAKGPASSAA